MAITLHFLQAAASSSAVLLPMAISGSFDVVLKDGASVQTLTLNKPDKALLIRNNIWRELENFSSGAVCLVLASKEFNEDDYIRDFGNFLEYVNANTM